MWGKYYLKYFNVVRDKLGWKNSYTLYSFRDTGITELLQSGVPVIDVMKLTDHSSLDVTSIYVKHIDKTLCNKISKIAPNFFRSKKNIIFAEILIIYIYDFRRKFKPTFYR